MHQNPPPLRLILPLQAMMSFAPLRQRYGRGVYVTPLGPTQELHPYKMKKALPDARVWACQRHSLSGSAPAC